MYAEGDFTPAEDLLADDVVWHVPGCSPISGDYRGREAVLGYFQHLADGRATLADGRTATVYRVADGRIAEAWLVPLDQRQFENAWAATRPKPFVYVQRSRPQDCAASTMLGHPRFLEFFEAAFIDCWRERFGPHRRISWAHPPAHGRCGERPLSRAGA